MSALEKNQISGASLGTSTPTSSACFPGEPSGAPAGAPAEDPNPSIDGNMMHITASPSALAQSIIYQILRLYLEILALDSKQKQVQAMFQAKEAEAQANATEAAGVAYGSCLIASGGISIIGSGISFAASNAATKNEYGKVTDKMNDIENEMAPIKQIEKFSTNNQSAKLEMGSDEETSAVKARADELRKGNYAGEGENAYDPSLGENDPKNIQWRENTKKALEHIKARSINDDTGEIDGDSEFMRFKADYEKTLNRKSQDLNTKSQEFNSVVQKRQNIKQIGDSVASALSQSSQGIGNVIKGKQDAIAVVNQTATSISANQVQEFGSAMSKAYDAAIQEITQVLAKITQANSVQG